MPESFESWITKQLPQLQEASARGLRATPADIARRLRELADKHKGGSAGIRENPQRKASEPENRKEREALTGRWQV
jgi:hypothetical protein